MWFSVCTLTVLCQRGFPRHHVPPEPPPVKTEGCSLCREGRMLYWEPRLQTGLEREQALHIPSALLGPADALARQHLSHPPGLRGQRLRLPACAAKCC